MIKYFNRDDIRIILVFPDCTAPFHVGIFTNALPDVGLPVVIAMPGTTGNIQPSRGTN